MHPWIAAFRNSRAGLRFALRSERAVRQEAIVLIVAVPVAVMIGETIWIRVALVGVLLLLIAVELLNTCVEKLCDHVTPEIHPQIKVVKDMGSAAVLLTLILAVVVWLTALLDRFGIV